MNTRTLISVVLVLLASVFAHAQVACDPLDYFYDDLEVWEAAGFVNNLPQARPYPLTLVKTILETVLERGDSTQRRIAQSHYDRFFGRVFTWGYKAELATDTYKQRKEMALSLSADLNFAIEELVTASLSADGWATNKLRSQELRPLGEGSSRDVIADNAKVGPFWILPSVNSSVAIGTDEYYLNAGIMRASFGPFRNGIFAGEQALHSGQYNFAANREKWGFNLSLNALTATDGYADKPFPEKYVSIHNFEWRPVSWFNISVLESIAFGGRLEPMYILPLSPYIISQGLTGFADSSWLGGIFTVKPFPGLRIDGTLYADDLSFNDIAHLNFDTKWRLAGQLGAKWAPPESGIFTLAGIDYTMVTPYAYSHKNGDPLDLSAPNYQNYTHYGENFGVALDPNSDRVNVKIKLRPLEDVDFDIVGVMIRHGNVNEGIDQKWAREYVSRAPGMYDTSGSVLNSSGSEVGHAYNDSTPFLTQNHVQYVWQTGIEALCRLPVLKTGGYIVFRLGYRFEYLTYPNIDEQVYSYNDSILAAIPGSPTEAEVDTETERQLQAWIDGLGNPVVNNYIRAGFEYHY